MNVETCITTLLALAQDIQDNPPTAEEIRRLSQAADALVSILIKASLYREAQESLVDTTIPSCLHVWGNPDGYCTLCDADLAD
jgi:hypothetical protein